MNEIHDRLTDLLMESYDKGIADAKAVAEKLVPKIVALAVENERKACAVIADQWATDGQKQFGNGGPGAVIRARGQD